MGYAGMGLRRVLLAAGMFAALSFADDAWAGLSNPSFEYGLSAGIEHTVNDASISAIGGWFTTEPDHQIEVWGTGFNGVPSFDGTDFVELNANAVGTLYQTTTGIAVGNTVDWHFAHRGRAGVDTMQLNIVDITTGQTLFSSNYSDGTTAWGFYSGTFTVVAGVAVTDTIKFSYVSISSVGGPSVGNFLDAADFGIGANSGTGITQLSAPEPASMALLGVGLAGLAVVRRRRRG